MGGNNHQESDVLHAVDFGWMIHNRLAHTWSWIMAHPLTIRNRAGKLSVDPPPIVNKHQK